MVRIEVVAIGKDKDRWVTEGIAHYTKLLRRWAGIEWASITPPRHTKATPPDEIRRREAERLPSFEGTFTIALSDRGRRYDSEQFAAALERWLTRSGGRLRFVIGGAYGLAPAVLDSADVVLSLSPLTFSHQVVRLVLLEQLYRAFSILYHTGYHK